MPLANSLTSLRRWASPPERDGEFCPRSRSPSPVSTIMVSKLDRPRVEAEELSRLLEAHGERVGDALSVPEQGVELRAVAATVAILAADVGVGHEIHLQLNASGSFAGFAATALCIEGEGAGVVTAEAGLGQTGVDVADDIKSADVGGWRGAGRFSDGDWSTSITLRMSAAPWRSWKARRKPLAGNPNPSVAA